MTQFSFDDVRPLIKHGVHEAGVVCSVLYVGVTEVAEYFVNNHKFNVSLFHRQDRYCVDFGFIRCIQFGVLLNGLLGGFKIINCCVGCDVL